MLQKIWEKYFLKEIAKTFFCCIIGFYFLYVLIDYSTRYAAYKALGLKFFSIATYYGYIFILRVEILVPFALIIATVKTLCSLNVHNELIALMGSGVPLKRLMRPFLIFTLFLTGMMYLNAQFFYPFASTYMHQIDREKQSKKQKTNLTALPLKDDGVILYHSYNPIDQSLFDVYWIRSIDEIYHAKTLFPYEEIPKGNFVDQLKRNKSNQLIPTASFESHFFSDLKFNPQDLREALLTPNELSITQLFEKKEKGTKFLTTFYRKLLIPWLSLLVFVAIAPFCLRFTRDLPIFFLYLGGMFGLVAFYLAMNAAVILGENEVVAPIVAVGFPFGALALYFGWRYKKL